MSRNHITFDFLSSKLHLFLGVTGKIFVGIFASFEVLIIERFRAFQERLDLFIMVENFSCLNIFRSIGPK